jgi:histidyl-tRNA synthetase
MAKHLNLQAFSRRDDGVPNFMSNTNPARGMRDFLPSDIRKRNYVIGIIKQVYESYGFEPLETPSVENLETLTGKYGEEGNQLIFKILKRGEKLDINDKELADLALRYDLTVPFSRVVANYKNDLPKYFKRYQIQPVWRADRPAKGRFREFYQCDVDAIGSKSMIVEVEVISAVCEVLKRLGFNDYEVRVNHREILRGILDVSGVSSDKHTDALVALDKIDKIGKEGVSKELREKGITSEAELKLLTFFDYFIRDKSNEVFQEKSKRSIIDFLTTLKLELKTVEEAKLVLNQYDESVLTLDESEIVLVALLKAINDFKDKALELKEFLMTNSNLKEIDYLYTFLSKLKGVNFTQAKILMPLLITLDFVKISEYAIKGVQDLLQILHLIEKSHLSIDPTLARGLSYYTGGIFEIVLTKGDFKGSIGGGGRYDGLIGMFGKEEIPACGFSLGLERIIVVMTERNMFPKDLQTNSADVFVTIWNEESIAESLKLANELRRSGLRVTVYPEADKLGKQFKYASAINVPYVCVVGDSELADGKVTVKNLESGEQQTVERREIGNFLKEKVK